MQQHLFILLFFTGVAPLTLSGPRKYYLIQLETKWTDAQAYCQVNHANLAIIQSTDDIIHFHNEAQRVSFSSSAWIGLYNDVTSWRWSLENEPMGTMTKWGSSEPNNKFGTQICVAMISAIWSDRTCTEIFPFACFDDRYTGNDRYIYISDQKSWHEAQSYCRQYHTDLASTKDEAEYLVVTTIINPSSYTWIGLFRDSWKWIDQTNFSTISWVPGQPDNSLGNEDCGYISNSQASDAKCSDLMPFFCYSVITGKIQVLRVKVQSSQDSYLGAAVQAIILEQIKQKLKDHGMAEDVTVKWRKQPDHVVFHKE